MQYVIPPTGLLLTWIWTPCSSCVVHLLVQRFKLLSQFGEFCRTEMVMTQEKETSDFVCYEFKMLELI